jgi:hypothetical protein
LGIYGRTQQQRAIARRCHISLSAILEILEVLHRLYWIFYIEDVPYYIFKGDHNRWFDPPVKRWQVKEVFREKAPYFGEAS